MQDRRIPARRGADPYLRGGDDVGVHPFRRLAGAVGGELPIGGTRHMADHAEEITGRLARIDEPVLGAVTEPRVIQMRRPSSDHRMR